MNTFTRYCKVIQFSIMIILFNNYQLDLTLLYLPLLMQGVPSQFKGCPMN